jgi:DNA-binding CsgD family transcriptional regulator
MEVYRGDCLAVIYEKDKSRIINSWEASPRDIAVFKKEMIEYLAVVKKIKPAQIIWLQQVFALALNDEVKLWIENNILVPVFSAGFITQDEEGFHHIAFVVGENVLTHIEITKMFSKKHSTVSRPKYFATEVEARNWLDNKPIDKELQNSNNEIEVVYKGVDTNGKAIIEYKDDASNINTIINLFERVLNENSFIKENLAKYISLTPREKEVLKLIIKGYTNKQVSQEMHISPNTVRTHRNRVWKKLDIKTYSDCLKYKVFFE